MEHTQVAAWILSAMNFLSPQRDHRVLATALATQLAEEHTSMSAEQMLKIASVEVAVMFREGSLIPDIIGDNGTSFCTAQINVGGGRTSEGWTGPELAERADRCVAVMDRMLTASMTACVKLPLEERLSSYARGTCSSKAGQRLSRDRFFVARKLVASVPVPAIEVEPEAEVLDLTGYEISSR